MNDDQMDELLIQGARDYNEPKNVVPREEMWSRIAEARRAAAPKAAPNKTWRWVGIAAAAAIVLAVGITIGRRLERDVPGAQNIAKAPTTPDSQAPVVAKNETPTKDTVIPQLRDETRNTDKRVAELAVGDRGAPDRGNTDAGLAYRLVMLRHVAGSEAMITAFRTSARRGEVDKQMADWARELLVTTRRLEASPVSEDPTMKRLLDDLDLVLMQIAQYTTRGTVNTEELDLIEESINKRGVIAKLRSTLPVRHSPTGT